MWIRAAGVCGVPEPLARETTRLQRTSAHGSVKHADEFFGGWKYKRLMCNHRCNSGSAGKVCSEPLGT